jgi:eukaryotic-like serine/threonine-protein kinase
MNQAEWEKIKEVFNAAIDLPKNKRGVVFEKCDENILNQVTKLLDAHENAQNFIVENAIVDVGLFSENETDEYIGKQIDDYKILKEIGHGGMGTVYLAAKPDETFDKKVALKLIKRGMDTTAVLKRFVMERKILASLENPYIANLIDGGSTSDGLPYLVMEYIEGEPITKFCDSHRFSITERLELFRKVCSAISYAHQNLVVHRDIKPSNILVTKDGTPKLLDFGIAKMLHPDWSLETDEATATMFRLMTPKYASPEQIRGSAITTASDVYSLGVVLYELLSGERPHKIESRMPQEVANIILTEEPAKPSEVATRRHGDAETWGEVSDLTNSDDKPNTPASPRLPFSASQLKGDLDNIILKALRKEPERRYSSVQEFSEDIRRHLANLPITARADTFIYRTDKFIRRHRFGVAAGLLIFLSLLSGITATTWQAYRANIEREKAERRFNESRKLSKFLMTDVFDSLGMNSGTGQIQKDLAQNTLIYLDNLAKEESEDVVLLGELADAYIKLGKVQDTTLNDTDAALHSFEKAVELGRRRIELAPNDLKVKHDLSGALFKVGERLLSREGVGRWLEVLDEIQKLQREIVVAKPDSIEDLFNLAGSYQTRGGMFDKLKRHEDARSEYQNALQWIEKAINLGKTTAQTPQGKIDLSHKYIWQGEIYAGLEDWQNSAKSNRTAGEIAEIVWRENPTLLQALRNTASSHRRLGLASEKLGDFQAALQNYQYSLGLIDEAANKNPSLRELKRAKAVYQIRVGKALNNVGETKQSIEMVKRGMALEREYILENRDRAGSIQYGFETFGLAAEFFVSIGESKEAIVIYSEWAKNIEELLQKKPNEFNLISQSAGIYSAIGDVYAKFEPETNAVKTNHRTELKNALLYYHKALNELHQMPNSNDFANQQISIIEEKSAQCETRLKKSTT